MLKWYQTPDKFLWPNACEWEWVQFMCLFWELGMWHMHNLSPSFFYLYWTTHRILGGTRSPDSVLLLMSDVLWPLNPSVHKRIGLPHTMVWWSDHTTIAGIWDISGGFTIDYLRSSVIICEDDFVVHVYCIHILLLLLLITRAMLMSLGQVDVLLNPWCNFFDDY